MERWQLIGGLAAALLALVGVGLATVGGAGFGDAAGADPTLAFEDVSNETGLRYASTDHGVGDGNASVYVADYDRDGWTDVLAIGGSDPVLFDNENGTFERSGALPPIEGAVHGALFVDHDNDGWEDLLVLRDGDTPLLLANDGGEFRVRDAGFEKPTPYPMGATAADYDGDGCTDLFVYQSGDWAERAPVGYNNPLDITDDNGNPNRLYRGTCSGFERVTDAGIAGERWSLAASFVDLTGDGRPDIHVANDYNNDTFYRNTGSGFERIVLGNATDRNGMSSEVADVNGDGRSDLFVTNVWLPLNESALSEREYRQLKNFKDARLGKRAAGNTLLINRANATFEFAAPEYGLAEGAWGWAAVIADLDNDGDRDAFHTTETFYTLDDSDPHLTYPMVWEREGDDYESRDASELGFLETDGRGVAELDYDNDGDRDLLVAQYDGRFVLYENRVRDGGNWLDVRVAREGAPSLGARVSITVDGETRHAVSNAKADFLSQDTRVLHFGLGAHETVEELRVVWPDGTTATYTELRGNRTVVVRPDGVTTGEGSASATAAG
jgi:hypothetical protein